VQAPVEEVSPFKLGDIQQLIKKIHSDTGDAVAPYFAFGMVFFLIAFCCYLALAIVSLVLDFQGEILSSNCSVLPRAVAMRAGVTTAAGSAS
jgi:hypothetical protein